MSNNYYKEGDICPNCNKDILVWFQENDTGVTFLKCQNCNYDATEIEGKKQ